MPAPAATGGPKVLVKQRMPFSADPLTLRALQTQERLLSKLYLGVRLEP